MDDEDGMLLDRVLQTRDFLSSVLVNDDLDDWVLARKFGDFLIRTPGNDDRFM
jgi:hypothetical protein